MRPTVSGAATHFPSSECLVSQTRLRFTHLFAVLLSAAPLVQPTVAHAQGGQIELRLDAVRVQSMSKNLLLGVSVPGSAAIAWYLTSSVAIDARLVGLSFTSTELPNGSTRKTTTTQFAAYLPIHFAGSRGRSGVFVAPGFSYGRSSGTGLSGKALTTWGVEAGVKKSVRGNVSLRVAATYEDGDRPETIGATGGVSVFFR